MADFRFLKPARLLDAALGRLAPSPARHLPRPGGRPALPLFDLRRLDARRRAASEAEIRALCAAVPLQDGTVLSRALGRYKLFVDPDDIGLSVHLMLDGYWEMWLTEAMAALARPGMAVLDAGAHLGYFTLMLADLVGETGRVDAVEPNPRLAGMLRRSIAVNGFDRRVTLHESPLGATAGEAVVLHVPAGLPQNGHTVPGGGADAVRTVTVDEIVGERPLDLVKIDVEGAEWDVWRGMRGVLARGRPLTVFLEFNAHRYAEPGRFLDGIVEHGFSLAQVDLTRGILPVDREAILGRRSREDWILLLTRG